MGNNQLASRDPQQQQQQPQDKDQAVVQLPIFQSRRTLDGYQDHSPQDLSLGGNSCRSLQGETATGKQQQFCSEAVAQQQQLQRPAGSASVTVGSRLPVFSTL